MTGAELREATPCLGNGFNSACAPTVYRSSTAYLNTPPWREAAGPAGNPESQSAGEAALAHTRSSTASTGGTGPAGRRALGRRKASWRQRLHAWWEGYELDTAVAPAGAAAAAADPVEEVPAGSSLYWSATRIEIVEAVWGDGFHTPGGAEHVPMLIKPFGLNKTMSVLDLGAGLGGTTRLMAEQTGAWVTGLEEDEVLRNHGMARSRKQKLDRQAPIGFWDPDKPAFDKKFDAVFAKECFFRVRFKEDVLDAVRASLKPRGQFLFTDYVLRHSASTGAAMESWAASEEQTPYPWTVGHYVERLKALKLDVRIAEDMTDLHCRLVRSAWERMSGELAGLRPDAETQALVVREAELWNRRVAALETGDLRLYRFFALA